MNETASDNERFQIERELGSDERLLWTGKPSAGLSFAIGDVLLLPFSLMWGGFAFFWEYQVIRSGAPLPMRLFGIPFVCVGLYLIAGRFFVDRWIRSGTIYAITSERAIIVTGLFSRRVTSINLRTIPETSLVERPDGSGSIVFARAPFATIARGMRSWPGAAIATGFDMIADARSVHEILRHAQTAATRPSGS